MAALAILRQPGPQPFDAVVLDYQMPDMDGAMLGEQIVKSRDIAPTRLMLLTSLDRSGDMQRFAQIGFSAYLTKPVRTRELLACLNRALSHDAQDWHMHSQPIITRGTLVATETGASTPAKCCWSRTTRSTSASRGASSNGSAAKCRSSATAGRLSKRSSATATRSS